MSLANMYAAACRCGAWVPVRKGMVEPRAGKRSGFRVVCVRCASRAQPPVIALAGGVRASFDPALPAGHSIWLDAGGRVIARWGPHGPLEAGTTQEAAFVMLSGVDYPGGLADLVGVILVHAGRTIGRGHAETALSHLAEAIRAA